MSLRRRGSRGCDSDLPAADGADQAVPASTGESGFVCGSSPYLVATNTAQSGVRWLDDIRLDRLQHIQDRHLRGGALWDEGTSYFNNADEIEALVTDAADWTPIIQSNGNLATIVDAGRPIGWDAATGAKTNLYTVIIKPGEGVCGLPPVSRTVRVW
ncbi:MAG TPA: hypothetical protein VGC03_09865 [Acidimicrobiia bacterium]|jgi:hypothetical protein